MRCQLLNDRLFGLKNSFYDDELKRALQCFLDDVLQSSIDAKSGESGD